MFSNNHRYYYLIIYNRVKKYQRRKNQRIDYNAEIPFEKRPAPGFYDTSEETVENEEPDFKRMKRSDVDGVRRSAEEEVCYLSMQGFHVHA